MSMTTSQHLVGDSLGFMIIVCLSILQSFVDGLTFYIPTRWQILSQNHFTLLPHSGRWIAQNAKARGLGGRLPLSFCRAVCRPLPILWASWSATAIDASQLSRNSLSDLEGVSMSWAQS